jgi:hypothetical protein
MTMKEFTEVEMRFEAQEEALGGRLAAIEDKIEGVQVSLQTMSFVL